MWHGRGHQAAPLRPVAARVAKHKDVGASWLRRHQSKKDEPEKCENSEDDPRNGDLLGPTRADCPNAIKFHRLRDKRLSPVSGSREMTLYYCTTLRCLQPDLDSK